MHIWCRLWKLSLIFMKAFYTILLTKYENTVVSWYNNNFSDRDVSTLEWHFFKKNMYFNFNYSLNYIHSRSFIIFLHIFTKSIYLFLNIWLTSMIHEQKSCTLKNNNDCKNSKKNWSIMYTFFQKSHFSDESAVADLYSTFTS